MGPYPGLVRNLVCERHVIYWILTKGKEIKGNKYHGSNTAGYRCQYPLWGDLHAAFRAVKTDVNNNNNNTTKNK